MLTIAVTAVSVGRDQEQQDPETVIGGIEQTSVGGTAANTPSELSGGIVGGTAANDLGTTGNTPSELAGGYAPDVFDRSHQRR